MKKLYKSTEFTRIERHIRQTRPLAFTWMVEDGPTHTAFDTMEEALIRFLS